MINHINSQTGRQILMNDWKNTELDNPTQVNIPPESFQPLSANPMPPSPSSSIMSLNFVHSGDNKSKYQEAHEKESITFSQQANRQNAILTIALAEINALSAEDQQNYAIRNHVARKAAHRMLEEKKTSTLEVSKKNLKEIKEDIERRTQETMKNDAQNILIDENCALPIEKEVSASKVSEDIPGARSEDAILSTDISLAETSGNPSSDVATSADVTSPIGSGGISVMDNTQSIDIII